MSGFNLRLWALASDDVWLRVGVLDTDGHGPDKIEHWHFDGHAWSQRLVSLPAPSEVWMFGDGIPGGVGGAAIGTFSFGPGDIWAVSSRGRWIRRHP